MKRQSETWLGMTARERFWQRVNKMGPIPSHRQELGPCWEWQGAKDAFGYGRATRTRAGQRRHTALAHRRAWELEHGRMPDLCVLHKCDNPSCVNPGHLFLGTRTDNSADKVAKGRSKPGTARGEQCGAAKLTEEDVALIRLAAETLPVSRAAIAKAWGIDRGNVWQIVTRRSWVHVP